MPPAIGPYRIDSELGRGGMGIVYLAHDTRLNRRVAIKALPANLAADPDRLARFEREAMVLASLNHPNIGAIHGLEEVADHRYLVLEYVEGQTLADRLKRGPLPIDEALPIARQIAEALEAAHEKGVIHRDLKPGNIMLGADGRVKVLDFGLARTVEAAPSSTAAPISDSPTISSPAPPLSPTIPGVILGTAGYMSPEQARGKPVDKRSDIFSFGCVLYEMLAGLQPFRGESVTDSLGAILHREPDWTLLPPGTPARLRELLASCLAKDRKDRLHDIADARLAIEHVRGNPRQQTAPPRTRREIVAWAVTGLVVAVAAGAWLLRTPAQPAPQQSVLRFTVQPPPGTTINTEPVNTVISPDGRRLAFLAAEPGQPPQIWVRDFNTVSSRVLTGTEKASTPFWSPDSRSIAFFVNGLLCRIPAEGGPVHKLAEAPSGRGGDWNDAGMILFAPFSSGPLHVVPQAGGTSRQVTELDASAGETWHRFPQFLPDGQRFLFAASPGPDGLLRTSMGSLDSRELHTVCEANSRATFAPGGWLLFDRTGDLHAQRFDPARGVLSAQEIATGIREEGTNSFGGRFVVSCSRTGAVASILDGSPKVDCVEVGPDGQVIRTLSPKPGYYRFPQVSPNGQALSVAASPIPYSTEIQLLDLTPDGVWRRFPGGPNAGFPRWSADGQWLCYTTRRASHDIDRLNTLTAGVPELVCQTGSTFVLLADVGADCRSVIFSVLDPKTGRDLWVIDAATKTRRLLAGGPSNEFDARLSPDGRLIAVATDESGGHELYIQDFLDARSRVRVSLSGLGSERGAVSPGFAHFRWSKDGSAILFLDADGRTVRSAAISTEPALSAARPEAIMQLPPNLDSVDIAPDGKSVFALRPAEGQAPCSISVTVNWLEGIKSLSTTGAAP